MNPIISPMWIYLIHVANTIYGISIVVLCVSTAIAFGLLIEGGTVDLEEERKTTYRRLKICAIFIIVSLLALIFVPDKKTMYAMIAASMITPDNISGVEEHVIDLIAKIADAVYNAGK